VRKPSIRGEAADNASFIEAMNNISGPIADEVVRDLGELRFNRLLDVGGASGTWTAAWLRAHPNAKATIFDLPAVIPMAEARIKALGISGRVDLVGGDFERDPLPAGADLAWVSAIIHQNSREQNRKLFRAVHEALAGDGRLLIRDVIMEDNRVSPAYGALFATNMLVATEGGGTFTIREVEDDLRTAGFGEVSILRRDPAMNSIVSARKE
jgi:SAM-dependent methyltransferase